MQKAAFTSDEIEQVQQQLMEAEQNLESLIGIVNAILILEKHALELRNDRSIKYVKENNINE